MVEMAYAEGSEHEEIQEAEWKPTCHHHQQQWWLGND